MSPSRPAVLDARALNRTLLARQMLLERAPISPLAALKQLVGMQAQLPRAPYHGQWSRLTDFSPHELSRLIATRKAVRIVLMRGTIHLVTAGDCLELRPLMRPVLERQLRGSRGRILEGVDLDAVAAEGRRLVEEQPRTSNELGAALAPRWPGRDPDALAHVVRALVPLVQIPPKGLWDRSGQTMLTSAEAWLGRPLRRDPSPADMVLRYLTAFGPASVRDIQTWCGLTRLKPVVEKLRHCTITFRDPDGRELFDVPDAPRPDPATPAPVRFLPEFDNLLLSHHDRTRVVAERDRHRVYAHNGFMRTVLVDGFVRASWSIKRERRAASLVVEPFERLSDEDVAAVTDEARRLLDVVAPAVEDVRVLAAS